MDNDADDNASISSKESEPVKPVKPKVMSELEKAVLRRRKAAGDDSDAPPDNNSDDEEDEIVKKPIKAKTSSNGPSSKTM